MFEDALSELDQIEAEGPETPEVVSFRIAIHSAMKNWPLVEALAKRMVEEYPGVPDWWISLAYATRRTTSLADARSILRDAEAHHPLDATIQFNLGCYACQSGEFDEAIRRVSTSITLEKSFQLQALQDPDLKEIREELAALEKAREENSEGKA